MRMILRAFRDELTTTQCLLCRDGKYNAVEYRFNGHVSIYDIDNAFGDYDGFLRYTNECLLRNL